MVMSKGDAIFLNIVALAETRRHAPGLCKRLRADHPSSILFFGAIFNISLLTVPPTITVSRKDYPQATPEEVSSFEYGEILDNSSHIEAHAPWLTVDVFWGGKTSSMTLRGPIPPLMLVEMFAVHMSDAGGTGISDQSRFVHRKSAQDDRGKSLPFVRNEVDDLIIEAQNRFRPLEPDDKGAPRTIYDYIEEKAMANPAILPWLDGSTITFVWQ
ncbi:hypothetical protein SCHPADRAFT_131708 [Schizopora paradoxa]|uniref:Uncharacterized protein n=1 Tax=Schizopora paradoxa TaxID=27342 RepID=A0A0H2SM46_9AGAM|nr:hypothetical protein SCHPADRAFT_131708 [Schizopora paradoxa]